MSTPSIRPGLEHFCQSWNGMIEMLKTNYLVEPLLDRKINCETTEGERYVLTLTDSGATLVEGEDQWAQRLNFEDIPQASVDQAKDQLFGLVGAGLAVTITMQDGAVFEKTVTTVKGAPARPYDVSEKFRTEALKVLPEEKVNHAIELVRNLEALDDISKLCALL